MKKKLSFQTRLYWLKMAILSLLLLSLTSCSKATPENQGKLIKTSVDAARASCLVLLSNPTIPRDRTTLEYCMKLSGAELGKRIQALDEDLPEDPPVVSPGDCPPVPTP